MGYYFIPDLTQNTKSVTIQLSSSGSIGYCQIPDNVRTIGVISSASTIRLAMNAVPSSASTVLAGSALTANFVSGMPLSASPLINWFDINVGAPNKVLYFRGLAGVSQVTVILV